MPIEEKQSLDGLNMISIKSNLLRETARLAYAGHGSTRLPILMYHRILATPDPLQPAVPDAALADVQFKVLNELFRVRPLEEAIVELQEGRLQPRTVCLTFDDGYRDNHDVALPLLLKHGLTATFYIASGFIDGHRMFNDTILESIRRIPSGTLDLSRWGLAPMQLSDAESRTRAIDAITHGIKYTDLDNRRAFSNELAHLAGSELPNDVMMTSEQVRHMAGQGMSIGGHTVNHPILEIVDDATAAREIISNRDALKDLIGKAPQSFAYPNGKPHRDYSAKHAEMARAAGYKSAVSTAFGVGDRTTDPFHFPRLVLTKRTYTRVFLQMIRASTHLLQGNP